MGHNSEIGDAMVIILVGRQLCMCEVSLKCFIQFWTYAPDTKTSVVAAADARRVKSILYLSFGYNFLSINFYKFQSKMKTAHLHVPHFSQIY